MTHRTERQDAQEEIAASVGPRWQQCIERDALPSSAENWARTSHDLHLLALKKAGTEYGGDLLLLAAIALRRTVAAEPSPLFLPQGGRLS